MRRLVAAAALLVAVLACGRVIPAGGGSGSSPRATAAAITSSPPQASPSPIPPAPAPASSQPAPAAATSLLLSGSIEATVTSAGARPPCGPTPAGFTVDLRFPYRSGEWSFKIALADYRGPGSYDAPPARVSVGTTGRGSPSFFAGQKGTIVVASGATSGTVDESLAGQDGPAHVTGTWHC